MWEKKVHNNNLGAVALVLQVRRKFSRERERKIYLVICLALLCLAPPIYLMIWKTQTVEGKKERATDTSAAEAATVSCKWIEWMDYFLKRKKNTDLIGINAMHFKNSVFVRVCPLKVFDIIVDWLIFLLWMIIMWHLNILDFVAIIFADEHWK